LRIEKFYLDETLSARTLLLRKRSHFLGPSPEQPISSTSTKLKWLAKHNVADTAATVLLDLGHTSCSVLYLRA
jgi:hypothetical protein